jgi:hypothetical protein
MSELQGPHNAEREKNHIFLVINSVVYLSTENTDDGLLTLKEMLLSRPQQESQTAA